MFEDFKIPSIGNSLKSAFGGAKNTLRKTNNALKRGMNIRIPTYKSKAKITRIQIGDTRYESPDRILAKLVRGKQRFSLERRAGQEFAYDVYTEPKGEYLGSVKL